MEVKDIELQACPHCGGDGVIEDEGGWCVYVTCCDCGAHTAQVDYHSPEERLPVGIIRRAAFCMGQSGSKPSVKITAPAF